MCACLHAFHDTLYKPLLSDSLQFYPPDAQTLLNLRVAIAIAIFMSVQQSHASYYILLYI